ncbi:MAG: hypothetical protein ABJC09_17965, partial [Terriglobia bacterium]
FPLVLSANDSERVVSEEGDGKVRIADKAGHSVVLTFDAKTGLPATESYSEGPGAEVEEAFSDWRDTGGVKLPRKVSIKQGGAHFADATITEITLNQGLTPEQLAKKP